MIKRKELEPSSSNYIRHGSDDNSRYSRKIIDPMYEFTCANAVAIGHLHIILYAHENGCRWDESTCEYAAKNGHLNILQYAHENGCRWNESKCTKANSHLNILCTGAAAFGHLHIILYAHENGCRWDEST